MAAETDTQLRRSTCELIRRRQRHRPNDCWQERWIDRERSAREVGGARNVGNVGNKKDGVLHDFWE
jgi:hypothetical protein